MKVSAVSRTPEASLHTSKNGGLLNQGDIKNTNKSENSTGKTFDSHLQKAIQDLSPNGSKQLRLSNLLFYTTADGPGIRHTIYTQGCIHKCIGCHNEHTHSKDGGKLYTFSEILDGLRKCKGVSGITLSGGDPLFQYPEVMGLLFEIRKCPELKHLNIMLYTGYSWDKVLSDFGDVLKYADSIMTERFEETLKERDLLFRGSSNQKWIDIPYYVKTGSVKEPQ